MFTSYHGPVANTKDAWGGAAIVVYQPVLTSGERLARSVWMVPGTINCNT